MEAANLGAFLAGVSEEELEEALGILSAAPVYTDEGYMQCAQQVLDMFRHGSSSLAVPTWFYGHEPSNLFSVHIAKYFSNSLREDGLLAIALLGQQQAEIEGGVDEIGIFGQRLTIVRFRRGPVARAVQFRGLAEGGMGAVHGAQGKAGTVNNRFPCRGRSEPTEIGKACRAVAIPARAGGLAGTGFGPGRPPPETRNNCIFNDLRCLCREFSTLGTAVALLDPTNRVVRDPPMTYGD